ncbi:MAG TPA: hypothetical protein VH115_04210 [Solirubrobacteraceae bacterium]|jgi:hypothetical protein|nr:hypothetical protein [Solirubrobacteraceae bacterium]
MIRRTHAVPGFFARATARVRGQALDGAVLAGADASRSRAVRARIELLSSPRHRERLADSIDGLVAAAGGPVSRVRVVPAREPVLANARGLHDLAQLLRAPAPVAPRGLAALTSLLSDGTGPVFHGDAVTLGERIDEVSSALASGRARACASPGAAVVHGTSLRLRDGRWVHLRHDSA